MNQDREQIEIGNKKIAEFMEDIVAMNCVEQGIALEYHSNWDWIMPVISKISAYSKNKWGDTDRMVGIYNSWHIGNIEGCFEAVVNFLNKYNPK